MLFLFLICNTLDAIAVSFNFMLRNFILFTFLVLPSVGSNKKYAKHTVPLAFWDKLSAMGNIVISLLQVKQ